MKLTGYAGVAMVVLVLFFEVGQHCHCVGGACGLIIHLQSGVFSIIFAMCIRGLGARTKMGSVMLTAATSGGAVIPVIMSAVKDSHGIRYGFCVAVAVFAFGLLLPLYTTVIPAARQQVDPVHKRSSDDISSDGASWGQGLGRVFSGLVKRNTRLSESATTEHIEEKRADSAG
ncbi:MAG: hypothetical protein Q9202_004931 [Teloschistes flavicans]